MLSFTAIATLIVASLKLIGSQTIDPLSVSQDTKEKWCDNQKKQCPLLCLQFPNATTDATEANDCDPTSLAYSCICSTNGQSPNASEYSLTIPYFECTESATQCVKKCSDNDASCQSACRTDHPCGAQSPTRVNISTVSTTTTTPTGSSATGASASAASTTDDSGVYTGFGGSTSTPSSGSEGSNGAQALVIGFGRIYGLVIVLASVCGGFVILL